LSRKNYRLREGSKMADPVYQDQPYMRKSFLFFSDVYLTGAVQKLRNALVY